MIDTATIPSNASFGSAASRRARARTRSGRLAAILAVITIAAVSLASLSRSVHAQDSRPYDDRLLRLSEILGAIHYLRELCGGNDGQLWREKMQDLIKSEGATSLRQFRLSRSFNTGYRSYKSTYTSCTPSAETAITRFLSEGAQIAETLARTAP